MSNWSDIGWLRSVGVFLQWASIGLAFLGALLLVGKFFVDRREKMLSSQATAAAIDEARREAATVARYEYRPLPAALRVTLVEQLKQRALLFAQHVNIRVTFETGALVPTRKYASDFADVLKEAGFSVEGADFATVFLIGQSFPMEFAYHDNDGVTVQEILSAFGDALTVRGVRGQSTAGHLPFHFAGRVVFGTDGKVSIE